MAIVSAALALLSSVIGAGFASGREIMRFFAMHGGMASAAVCCASATLFFLFLRLCAQLETAGCGTLGALCRARLGRRLGALCSLLFLLLSAVTGGAMLCACAELAALTLYIPHAYALGMIVTLLAGILLTRLGMQGLALPGAALVCLLPALLLRLLALEAGEACFLPAMTPDLPVRAALDGAVYGALNAAMLAGMLPMLTSLGRRDRFRAALLFSLLFGALLALGVMVCRRHMPEIYMQPLPFVFLSRALGAGGYCLVAACLYAAALSTLCAMLAAIIRLLPFGKTANTCLGALFCLLFAMIGFGPLVSSGYPVLGALCAGLLIVLCLPGCPSESVKSVNTK